MKLLQSLKEFLPVSSPCRTTNWSPKLSSHNHEVTSGGGIKEGISSLPINSEFREKLKKDDKKENHLHFPFPPDIHQL